MFDGMCLVNLCTCAAWRRCPGAVFGVGVAEFAARNYFVHCIADVAPVALLMICHVRGRCQSQKPCNPKDAMLRAADHSAFSAEAEFGTRLHERDPEHQAVAEYFASTLLACTPVRVRSVTRLHNAEVYRRYSRTVASGETLMFHGCKTARNEEGIIRRGFDVSCCKSGGARYGTWLAYSATYSNAGYVRVDTSGLRHIFVCVVSYHQVVRDDATMRVVGQDCAYPIWLLKYDL